MKKHNIKNRKGQKIIVIVESAKNKKGLAFVMHGLGGFKEQLHIQTIAQAFEEEGYTAVRFDTTNTFGESEGNYEDATVTNYYEDLEDVIKWAEKQDWYKEPFFLAGHSLGGMCITIYAGKNPDKVKAIAPISTAVSGKLSYEYNKEEMENWEKTGYKIEESRSKPGVIKKLKWSHMTDRLKYNLLENINKLKMPVLLIVGDKDKVTPLAHQKILYNELQSKKELHIIKNAGHTFRDKEHLEEINKVFRRWLIELR